MVFFIFEKSFASSKINFNHTTVKNKYLNYPLLPKIYCTDGPSC
jgi:hypothetical protein